MTNRSRTFSIRIARPIKNNNRVKSSSSPARTLYAVRQHKRTWMHHARGKSNQPPCGVGWAGVVAGASCGCAGWAGADCAGGGVGTTCGTACGAGFTPGAAGTAGAFESAFGTDITPKSCSEAAFGLAVWVAFQAMNSATPKNRTPSHLVDFDRKLDEPREPNTVDDAPAPKPEPADAPAPRCIKINAIIAIATNTYMTLRINSIVGARENGLRGVADADLRETGRIRPAQLR